MHVKVRLVFYHFIYTVVLYVCQTNIKAAFNVIRDGDEQMLLNISCFASILSDSGDEMVAVWNKKKGFQFCAIRRTHNSVKLIQCFSKMKLLVWFDPTECFKGLYYQLGYMLFAFALFGSELKLNLNGTPKPKMRKSKSKKKILYKFFLCPKTVIPHNI